MAQSSVDTFIARWQGQLPQSLAGFAVLANEVEDVNFTTGILAAAVVWPIREPVREYDGDAADAVQQIAGAGAGGILKVVNQLPEDRAAGARALEAAAREQPALRDGLVKLIERFDAAQLFAEQLASQIQTRYGAPPAGGTFNITEEIKAALVNIGGITNIKQLSVHLSLPAPTEPPSHFRRWGGYTVGAIGLLASLLALVQFVVPYFSPRPVMTGGFNVAIAEFARIDERGRIGQSPEARRMSETVERALDDELKELAAGVDIEIWSPQQTGRLDGATVEQQREAAEQLADEIKADLIFYGYLDADNASIVPHFYLSQRKLGEAEELIGEYQFGAKLLGAGNIADNPASALVLSQQIGARANLLAKFTLALGFFALDQFDQAATYFDEAAGLDGWGEVKEVVYLFQGTTAGKRGDLDAAEAYFAQALELEPEYARARLGAAEVQFQKARGGSCEPDQVDRAGLLNAARGFESALTAQIQPEPSDISTKTAFFLGRAYFCLSRSQVADHWDDAARAFGQVVDDYRRGDEQKQQRLQDRAAEAHNSLGLIYLTRDEPPPLDKVKLARGEWSQAITLARSRERKALFYVWRAYSNLLLEDCAGANADLSSAVEFQPSSQAETPYVAFRQQVERQVTGSCQGTTAAPASR